MINIRTVSGILICLLGILLVKLKNFINMTSIEQTISFCSGVLIAFSGIACFASGLKKRISIRIKICPDCFYRNDIHAQSCKNCHRVFPHENR